MIESCKYDPTMDLMPVMPERAVDLGQVLRTGRVPANVAIGDESYNNISNPADIAGKPSDNFDAARLQRAYAAAAQAATAPATEETHSESGGAAAPAPQTSAE